MVFGLSRKQEAKKIIHNGYGNFALRTQSFLYPKHIRLGQMKFDFSNLCVHSGYKSIISNILCPS